MSRHWLRGAFLVSLLFALAAPSAVWAQGVFKCAVNGKTVYQAEPCEGQGSSLQLQRGPSEQEVREARKRADADRASMTAADARVRQRAQQQQQTQRTAQSTVVASKADCASLDQRRAAAYGRRNGAFRMSRNHNVDLSRDVYAANDEIAMIEARMTQAGCSLQ